MKLKPCSDCGRVEKEPYCDGDECICGGILKSEEDKWKTLSVYAAEKTLDARSAFTTCPINGRLKAILQYILHGIARNGRTALKLTKKCAVHIGVTNDGTEI